MRPNRRIGGNQTDKPRAENDFYPTPEKATLILLKHHKVSKSVWEPACGEMDMSNVLIIHGHDVKSTDIATGHDVFEQHEKFDGDIVTNPPYSLSLEFIEKCLALTDHNICMLLPIGFMTSAKRRPLLQSGKLKKVIIITDRLKIKSRGEMITSQFNHIWCVFRNDGVVDKPELIFE